MTPVFKPRLALPDSPAVGAGQGRAAILTPDGELLSLPTEAACARLAALPPPLLVHAPATFRRLGLRPGPAFDLLELFAFVLPARTAPPTARGLCGALGLDPPARGFDAEAAILPDIAAALLRRLAAGTPLPINRDAAGIASWMGRAGWGWAPAVLAALGRPDAPLTREALQVWRSLPEWEETAPLPPPGS
ncbi:MAG: ATP-dependent DNA helicase, partial [Acetobacteraceae bacterium]|nr:ATP-dependent DNA helicase [Acetobacteraceae bacterium]